MQDIKNINKHESWKNEHLKIYTDANMATPGE